jgi:hypothetical protein
MDKEDKIENVLKKGKETLLQIDQLKAYMAELRIKQRILNNRAIRIKEFVKQFDKGTYGKMSLSFRKSEVVVVKIDDNKEDIDFSILDDKYIKTTLEPRKDMIKQALKNGDKFKQFVIEKNISVQIK